MSRLGKYLFVKGNKNMEQMNKAFEVANGVVTHIVDIGIKLLAMGIILQIIFGTAVPFVGVDILGNVIKFVGALGSQGLVGLVAIGVLVWAFNKK